ncbi:hypothetical protein CJJ23_01435 [Mycoplasmopsis agassizii]|uniref:Uncharacterized protein n=1 Tax=Mycoplasmopsis agassizii TaxID=33922 RepID=A0A269TJH0_9BACT|nr:hypothetical protein [Mycoplasmopsis agassizii]PAK21594.1 hypothetical protein CJJ23_01435 [Mycoplasmopsis agassizii]
MCKKCATSNLNHTKPVFVEELVKEINFYDFRHLELWKIFRRKKIIEEPKRHRMIWQDQLNIKTTTVLKIVDHLVELALGSSVEKVFDKTYTKLWKAINNVIMETEYKITNGNKRVQLYKFEKENTQIERYMSSITAEISDENIMKIYKLLIYDPIKHKQQGTRFLRKRGPNEKAMELVKYTAERIIKVLSEAQNLKIKHWLGPDSWEDFATPQLIDYFDDNTLYDYKISTASFHWKNGLKMLAYYLVGLSDPELNPRFAKIKYLKFIDAHYNELHECEIDDFPLEVWKVIAEAILIDNFEALWATRVVEKTVLN